MADIVLLDGSGDSKTYTGIESITIPTADGGAQTFFLLKIASATEPGIVMPDGITITINKNGVISGRDAYTKEQVNQLLTKLSELLISDDDFAALSASVNTLMGESVEFSSIGGSMIDVDNLADTLLR